MKTIGMLGGLGPESTADYYKRIIEEYRRRTGDNTYPHILINSLNMTAVLALAAAKDWDALTDCLAGGIQALADAGADFGFIASNTPHVVFDRVQALSPIPLISIVEAAACEAEKLGLKKAGLLGTAFTMESSFYQDAFAARGIDTATPNEAERRYLQQKLMDEIELGIFLDETREGLLRIAGQMVEEDGADGIVLGCTELPLIITQGVAFGVPFLNTAEIHVERIVEECVVRK